MIYGLQGYDGMHRNALAPRRPMGQATSTVGGGGLKPTHIVLIGLGLLAAGYVMTQQERKAR